MHIDGTYLNGKDSNRYPARLELDAYGVLLLHYDSKSVPVDLAGLRISPRVGKTERYLYLDDAGVFETADNDAVDDLGCFQGAGKGSGLLYRLESNLGWIASTAVLVLAFVVLSFTHGIPWVSKQIAWHLPSQVDQYLGGEVLEALDQHWLSPSELPDETQARVLAAFQPHLEEQLRQHPERNLQVKLRHSELIGANAVALPSGEIIFTDDLIELAAHDDELVAILGHEIGHVAHRHSLRSIVQSSLTVWLVVSITGDISAASELTATVPALLADLAYSRDMEHEADEFALEFMQSHSLDPNHFAEIMTRLSASHRDSDEKADEDDSLGFLSTHPPTPERIKRFRTAN